MKNTFISTLLILVYLLSIGQKPNRPYSCYQLKSKTSAKTSATVDSRDHFFDIENYKIVLDITDFVAKEISGFTQIRFDPLQDGINSMELDFLKLDIDSIYFQGNLLTSYTYNDTIIKIDFPSTLIKNNERTLVIYYHGKPVQYSGDWGGFFWNNTYAYNVGVSFTEDVHNFGKAWFPCIDNFTQRSTYDFIIKTQANHKAFCNGELNSTTTNLDGTKNWTWKLEQKIPTYLASVAVANYATVNDTYIGISTVPIQLAAKVSDTTNLKASFIHLKDAMSSFEHRFGKYRFDRIGYCVTSFSAGAMEHATNITYMENAVNGNTQYETLMAHELSHHWWGNNTTCSTAGDMWLNEGFASFSEAIFTESVYGEEAYKDYARIRHDFNLRRLHINEGYLSVAGVSTENTYSATVYRKGADMIHTLRGILGDDIFFGALKSFQSNKEFSSIDTDMFNDYLSNYSNLNLTSFFNTWIKEPGFHHFAISEIDIIDNNGTFLVQGSVKQKLRETSAYTDFMPIKITFFNKNWETKNETVFIYGECSEFEFDLDFEPIFWALDYNEGIQDATVDKHLVINSIGTKDFGLARLELDVQTISDSSLVRVTHHYIKPDPMNVKIANLHLSPNRYWSVEGIFSEGFTTNAKFLYNGSTNVTSGYLDNDFINNSEDSLVMLYRPDAKTEWSLVTDFVVNTQGSSLNKKGFITVNNLQKGDYVMAEYDASIGQDVSTKSECLFTGIENILRLDKLISIYPVPAKKYLNIEFLAPINSVKQIIVYNVLGREIQKNEIQKNEKLIKIDTKNWTKGVYLLNFLNESEENVFSKKFIVE